MMSQERIRETRERLERALEGLDVEHQEFIRLTRLTYVTNDNGRST